MCKNRFLSLQRHFIYPKQLKSFANMSTNRPKVYIVLHWSLVISIRPTRRAIPFLIMCALVFQSCIPNRPIT